MSKINVERAYFIFQLHLHPRGKSGQELKGSTWRKETLLTGLLLMFAYMPSILSVEVPSFQRLWIVSSSQSAIKNSHYVGFFMWVF